MADHRLHPKLLCRPLPAPMPGRPFPAARPFPWRPLAVFLSAALLSAAPARASTWYAAPASAGGNDANPGTQALPLNSFYQAGTKAQPGDTVYFRGGTYAYTQGQWIPCSGTPSAWITIAAYPGETPVIDGSAMPATVQALGVGGQYLVIEGFTVQNAPQSGILSWNTGHLKVLDNTVFGCKNWGIYAGAASFGAGGTDILIDGNRVYRNVQSNNPPCADCGWPAGISTYWTDGVTISRNATYQNFGEGIAVSHSDNVLIAGNTAYDNYSVEIYFDNARSCTVAGNWAYSTLDPAYYRYGYPAEGISCANENFTSATNPLDSDVIVNNVAFHDRCGFYYGNYQNGGGMKNFILAGNTFCDALDTLLKIDPDPGHAGNLVADNVFDQSNGNTLQSLGAPVSAFTFSHNAWYGGSPGAGAGPGDVGLPPLLVNPGTVNATDYAPQAASPLVDAGVAVSAVTVDFRGVPRPQGAAYDIGAFELTPPSTVASATPTSTATRASSPTPSWTPTSTPSNLPTFTQTPLASPIVFPNPAKGPGPVTLEFGLESPAAGVEVKVFTTAFRRVRETSLGPEPAGAIRVPLDLSDDRGTPLADGLYYVVVSTPRGFSTARLLVLR